MERPKTREDEFGNYASPYDEGYSQAVMDYEAWLYEKKGEKDGKE